jgi:phosphopantothenoylcysteine decarboxylase/phosphopantothenate--cysteine ligase
MIVLGVTGSIAAYKAAEILRGFIREGHDVHVVMTQAATRFIGPLTFQGLSGHPVITDVLEPQAYSMAHLELTEKAQAFVIAPASAESIARLAMGRAGDIISALALALPRDAKANLKCPVFIAPAMHDDMWRHPATQANVKTLMSYGYRIIGPERGPLGRTGDEGEGRLSDPDQIVKSVLKVLRS